MKSGELSNILLRKKSPIILVLITNILIWSFDGPIKSALKAIFDATVQDFWKDTLAPFLRKQIGDEGLSELGQIHPFWIGALLTIALIYILDSLLEWYRGRYKTRWLQPLTGEKRMLIGIMLFSTIVFCGAFIAFVSQKPSISETHLESVREDFKSTGITFRSQLGDEIGPVDQSDLSYIAEHQNAVVFWGKSFGKIYGLFPDSSVLVVNHPIWTMEPKHFDEKELIKTFPEIPVGYHPPVGGVASAWNNIKSVGWRKNWQCKLDSKTTFYQKFEKGLLIGILPAPHMEGKGYIYAIFNNNTWSLNYSINSKSPACS